MKSIIFWYLKQVKAKLKYPKEQISLIIIDIFKGQHNDVIPELFYRSIQPHKQVSTTWHNLNKPGKSFISDKYNEWFSMQVSQQLKKNIQPADVQVFLILTELKVMHVKWILELYIYLCRRNEIILHGFKAASMRVESANTVLEKIENPFSEQ